MFLVEEIDEPRNRLVIRGQYKLTRDLDRHFVRLSEIPHVYLIANHHLLGREPEFAHSRDGLPRDLSKDRLHLAGPSLAAPGNVGAVDVVPGVGGDQADGGEDPAFSGTMTRGMRSSWAIRTACIAAVPPEITKLKSRGSWPSAR